MSADVTLSEAITALVAEKRAVGYKYDAEARVLAYNEDDVLATRHVRAWLRAAD